VVVWWVDGVDGAFRTGGTGWVGVRSPSGHFGTLHVEHWRLLRAGKEGCLLCVLL